MNARQCSAEGCERTSALPEPYPPQCARHYLGSVNAAVKAAEAQTRARLAALRRETQP